MWLTSFKLSVSKLTLCDGAGPLYSLSPKHDTSQTCHQRNGFKYWKFTKPLLPSHSLFQCNCLLFYTARIHTREGTFR